jgi:penicillin-binding protein 1A
MTPSQRHRHRRQHGGGLAGKALLAGAVVGIVAILGGLSLVLYVVHVAATAPPLASLKAKEPGENSIVYAADGQRLGVIQADELRRHVQGDQVPTVFQQATVAIEDQRFYKHKGVDYEGVVRAAVKNVTSKKTVQGGSTITMQLVRNIYTGETTRDGLAGYKRKIREAKLAEELENEHTKQWILDKYLDSVPYGTVGGQTAIGAWAAARVYFNKPVEKLKLHEAALLAGLPQAPSLYSPIYHPEAAMARRNEVLRKMAELHMITPQQATAAIAHSLGIKPSAYYSRRRESYVFDYVKDQLIQEYGARTVRGGGLKVYTSIDLKLQQSARAAIAANLAGVGPSSALVTIDPRNGYIKAMVSSADYGQSKFNLAAQGHRQPGSTFKVMALMTALRKGVDPDRTSYVSKRLKFKDPKWGPIDVQTYDHSYGGSMSLTKATLKSDNTVYEQLALDLGPEEIKKTAYMMGIRTHLDGLPAESLGGLTIGVSPLEMASAYGTIANGGYRVRPTAITKIEFPDGHVEKGHKLPPRFRVKRIKAFSDGVTAKATQILEKNVQAGTGTRAQIGCPAAGKTGTVDNFTDAWFVGFTPRLATSVWVGYPTAKVEMRNLFQGGPVAGGTFPAQIWGAYMKKAKGRFCGEFAKPKESFVASPFFGHYSRTGGKGTGEDTGQQSNGLGNGVDTPGGTGRPQHRNGGGQDTNGGTPDHANGRRGFDPNFYESPPQKRPKTQAPEGGTGAPG